VDNGNTVLLIEHNLDLIKNADWIIDLGPGAGDRGGEIIACGTPEELARVNESHTGYYIEKVLSTSRQPLAQAMAAAGN
jgi:excinuclease ABC subunit A